MEKKRGRMVCIGPGPGPKNVLVEHEDGTKTVVPYAIWKHRYEHLGAECYAPRAYTSSDREDTLDAVVKILGVAVGTTNSGRQYFDVQCSDGQERRCWNAQLAQKINGFANTDGQGPDVTLRYDVKQNGQYTNYSIKAAFGPGEMVVAETQGFAQSGGGNSGGGGRGYPPEVTTRITKLASFEYATTLVGALFTGSGPEALEQAYEMTADVAKRIYKEARAHEKGGTTTAGVTMLPQATQLTPVASDAQGVAGFVNQEMSGAVQVGAPVAQAQDAAAEAPDTVEWD